MKVCEKLFYFLTDSNFVIQSSEGKPMSDAFITSPVLRSPPTSEMEKKLSANLRQKINNILKSFTQRELLFQAVNNIGIPKNFINPAYVESRPDEQLNKIYNTICALKKQVLRIKRYSDTPKGNNIFALQSLKNLDHNPNKVQPKKSKGRQFLYLKNQISPEKRIKQAIIEELQYRQKLQTRQSKLQTTEKNKAEFNQKRKQAAKLSNKRSLQVYERQKQIQDKWFDKIINSQPSDSRSESPTKSGYLTAGATRRQQNFDSVKERLEQSKTQFEKQIVEQQIGRVMKQKSLKDFKHRRLNSINQRMNQKRLRSHEIRQRKNIYSQEEQFFKIKKMIHKELKIKETRQQKSCKDSRNSESQIQTSTMMGTINIFRNTDARSINYEKDDEKQNQIMQKLIKKNQARQNFINSQVDKIKEKHKISDMRRQAFKKTQFKLLTQVSNNESYIYQKEMGLAKKPVTDSQRTSVDALENNIKKKHENVLKTAICDQTIIRLRKLPKSVLEKKLKDFKTKELRQIFAQNIVKFLN